MTEKLTRTENYFIVDSIALEICKLSRSPRRTICKEDYPASPSKGYCAIQKKLHFYGYKLHTVCSTSGVFSNFELTQVAVRDIHYLKNTDNIKSLVDLNAYGLI